MEREEEKREFQVSKLYKLKIKKVGRVRLEEFRNSRTAVRLLRVGTAFQNVPPFIQKGTTIQYHYKGNGSLSTGKVIWLFSKLMSFFWRRGKGHSKIRQQERRGGRRNRNPGNSFDPAPSMHGTGSPKSGGRCYS